MDVRSPEKPSLPAKKVWSNSPGTPRRDESKAPSATPVLAQPAPSQTYVSAETARTGAPADGAKSFLTSKDGIGVIAGAVLAGGLTVFFLTGHGKAANAAKSKVTESAQAASTASPVVPAVTDQSSDGKPSTDKTSAATAPRVDAKTGAKQEPPPAARPGVPQTTAAQQPPASLQPTAAVPPPVTESTRTIARAFTPPTPSAGPANSQILEAPPALNAGAAAPAGVAVPARIAPLPPPPAPRAAPSPAPNATQPRQVVVTGKAQATKLIHQVLPNYPALAKTARVQGTVRFRVTIGADGHVKTLTTLGGPLPLVTAASEAVKQWLYEPTVADGQAVEVISEIDVAFAL
jgi:protein TonB